MERISSDELRKLVREALREALPASKPTPSEPSSFVGKLRAALTGNRRVEVAIAGDADVTAFAQDLARACEQQDVKNAVMAGQLSFALKRGQAASAAAPARSTHRMDKGVLTEALVIELGKTHGRVVLGKGVAITPLARDRAREAKLEIVREKP
jgi:hypothetical protein